jgi:hypothetical protein
MQRRSLSRVRTHFAWGGLFAFAVFASRAGAETPTAPQADTRHPLDAVLRFAREEHSYLERAVQDYTCRIVKRERVSGKLQSYQSILARVRPASSEGDFEKRPLAVFLQFEGPREVAGRRVLFVENAFDNMMLVRQRRGGITLRVRVDGGLAARETAVPITTIGFHNMIRQTIEQLEDDKRADPAGENTEVEIFRDAKIDDRPCTAVRIAHPRRQADLDFHLAHVFIDEQSHLPVRLDFYDWPDTGAQQPVLLGEFTYSDVEINVGLGDADFDPQKLGFHVSE